MVGDTDDVCYAGIFKSGLSISPNTIFIGNVFMHKYYVVFDMTPYDERDEDYIQIGIGPKFAEPLMGKQQYDPSWEFYWPLEKDMDISENVPPHPDPYDT